MKIFPPLSRNGKKFECDWLMTLTLPNNSWILNYHKLICGNLQARISMQTDHLYLPDTKSMGTLKWKRYFEIKLFGVHCCLNSLTDKTHEKNMLKAKEVYKNLL